MNLINDISKIVSDAFVKCGYEEIFGLVNLSNRPDLGQFSCNGAMQCAKIYKKSPFSIAEEIVKELSSNSIFSKVEAINPGFININLSNEYLENIINTSNNLRDLVNKIGNNKIIIDYGGPNVAKPLHVGHMRTANIGEAIKRIGKFLGHEIIGDVHLGDWGFQMGLVLTEIKYRYPDLNYFKENYLPSENDICPVTIDQLNEIYPTATKKANEDEMYKNEAYKATGFLQTHTKGYYDLWKKIVEISINDMKSIYHLLNVEFDLWYGESTSNEYVPILINILEEKNLLEKSQGAMIVHVSEDNDKKVVPPVIIIKSDGSQLYQTTDLATIVQRKAEINPDEIIYVVDNRQELHFEQIFRVSRKAQLVNLNVNLEFVGFGTLNGKDGKPFKTRDGGIMKLENLIFETEASALEKINTNPNNDFSEEEKKIIANKIAISALKFGDLYNQRSKDYIFDVERFLSFEGKTGPYILYSISRINSIFKKVGEFPKTNIKLYSNTEIEIILNILMSENYLEKAFLDKAPNYICEHVYNIASLFSRFYDENIIMTEKDLDKKYSWLNLLLLVKNSLINLLDLLAIDYLERM